MTSQLDAQELTALVQRVFAPRSDDRHLAILVDLPDQAVPDTAAWKDRRLMAAEWWRLLSSAAPRAGLEAANLVLFRNSRANNADLPAEACIHRGGPLPDAAEELPEPGTAFADIFRKHQILIAPTQFSLTAPLKRAAAVHGFRAALLFQGRPTAPKGDWGFPVR